MEDKDMRISESVSLLQSYFDFFYAKEISEKMFSVFKNKCFGCQNSRLSQMDHTCLTLTDEHQLDLYFEDVLLDVDETDILLKWNDAVSVLEMSSALIEMFKLKINCKDWRETDMRTAQWRAKMINMTVQLLQIERRFEQLNSGKAKI